MNTLKWQILFLLTGVAAMILSWPFAARAQTNTFPQTGNAGIGTTSPSSKVHIISSDDTVAPAVSIRQDTNPLFGFDLLLDTNVNGNLYLNRVNNGTSANVLTFDRAGGNVGIGTLAPPVMLTLFSTANTTHAVNVDAQGTGNAQQATINLITLGDGTKSVLGSGTKGWHFTARGDAFTNVGEQDDLELYSWNGTSAINSVRERIAQRV